MQGPTSSGKTSLVAFLAAQTGHTLVRINNHEQTDLQEYLGSYISDETGRLVFREGALVEAVRQGHWLLLDELNLAPSQVLEALNRWGGAGWCAACGCPQQCLCVCRDPKAGHTTVVDTWAWGAWVRCYGYLMGCLSLSEGHANLSCFFPVSQVIIWGLTQIMYHLLLSCKLASCWAKPWCGHSPDAQLYIQCSMTSSVTNVLLLAQCKGLVYTRMAAAAVGCWMTTGSSLFQSYRRPSTPTRISCCSPPRTPQVSLHPPPPFKSPPGALPVH